MATQEFTGPSVAASEPASRLVPFQRTSDDWEAGPKSIELMQAHPAVLLNEAAPMASLASTMVSRAVFLADLISYLAERHGRDEVGRALNMLDPLAYELRDLAQSILRRAESEQ